MPKPIPEDLDPVKDALVNEVEPGETITVIHASCHCCGAKSLLAAFSPIVPTFPPCECAAHPHCFNCNKCGWHCTCGRGKVYGRKEAYLLNHTRPGQMSTEITRASKQILIIREAAADWLDLVCEDDSPLVDREPKIKDTIFEAVLEMLYSERLWPFVEEIEKDE